MAPSGKMQPSSQGTSMAAAPQKPSGPSPPFNMFAINSEYLNKSLTQILDGFFECSKVEALAQQEVGWPEAQGQSYKDVLGQPVAMPSPVGNMGPPQPGMPAAWQPQQGMPMSQGPPGAPVQGGNAPQMMPVQGGNFMVAQAPGGGAGGQTAQMFQPMYSQGPGGPMPGQRPQNPANSMQQPQDQQPMQNFQQGMIAQQPGPQNMAVNMQVNPQGGQNPGGFTMPMQGGAMPKYGAMQMVMVPTGQFQPGQFVPQQGGQQGPGQPGPGGPPGGPQPGGPWQQGHMAMPHMMQQVGPRGPEG
jgi:hypothetical protein